jgi:hypothetical protein
MKMAPTEADALFRPKSEGRISAGCIKARAALLIQGYFYPRVTRNTLNLSTFE